MPASSQFEMNPNDEKQPLIIANNDEVTQEEEEEEDSSSPPPPPKSPLFLATLVFSFIIMSIIATVGRKLVLDAFGQHLAFFRQFLGVFMYDIWCTIIVGYKLIRTNDIPSSVRQTNPIYFFAGIGFLDGFGDFLSSVGGVHSPGAVQTLLGQLVIPFTLVIAFFVTKSTFTWIQVLGAFIIVGGVVVATIPDLQSPSSAEGEKTYWYSILVFAISQIPQAASVVCKDFLFKRSKAKLDVFYLSCLVSWTQLFLIWIFVPLQSFKSLGGVPLDEIGNVMEDGAKCFIGQDVPQNRDAINWTAIDLGLVIETSIKRCSGGYVTALTFAYSITGFAQGVLQLLIVKHHSAALAILCNAIVLPMSNLAYSVPAFVGGSSKAEPFSVLDIVGLLVTVCGLLVYQYKSLREEFCDDGKSKEEKEDGDNNNNNNEDDAGQLTDGVDEEERVQY